MGSSLRLPIKRLTAKIVFSGLVMACLLAICPTNLSPLSVKATTEGVVRLPSAFARTLGSPVSMIATQELVVPKSIPITFAILITPQGFAQITNNKCYLIIGRSVFNLAPAVFFLFYFWLLRYTYQGGAKQSVVKQVTLMVFFHNRIRLVVLAFHLSHGLVFSRIERLSDGRDLDHPMPAQDIEQSFENHFDSFH